MLTHFIQALATTAAAVQSDQVVGEGPDFFPPQASTIAETTDHIYLFIFWVSLVSFCILIGVTAYFVWKYRARDGHKEEWTSPHNNLLEVTWTVIPTIIVVFIFWFGMKGFLDLRQPPGDALNVQVVAQKWSWKFVYPNGAEDVGLHVPVGRPVRLTMTSVDVLHSLSIPAFRVKQDVVPGRYTTLWFDAKDGLLKDGEDVHVLDLFCTEYCGENHSKMLSQVFVHTDEDFARWAAEAANFIGNMSQYEAGRKQFIVSGCNSCHEVTAETKIGPGLLNVSQAIKDGGTIPLADGSTVPADLEYLRESILNANVKIHAGFTNQMPLFQGQLRNDQLGVLTTYILGQADESYRSLGVWGAAEENGGGEGQPAEGSEGSGE